MVNSVSPDYYAGLDGEVAVFNLTGNNLYAIPSNAIGILSRSNDNPTALINSTASWAVLNIVSQNDTEIELRHDEDHTLDFAFYLGAIVSQDRQTVFWTNENRPLP